MALSSVVNYTKLESGAIMQYGFAAFATSGTTVEVPTKLPTLIAAFALPQSYTGSAAAGGEVMFCDLAITSGAVTFARKVAVDSGLVFSYSIIGTYGSVGGM